MTTNLSLSYGGHTPAAALTGMQPRELYDHENPGLAAQIGIWESVPDAVETSIRLRIAAKDAISSAIVEDRLARAHNTRVQQLAHITMCVSKSQLTAHRAFRTLPEASRGTSFDPQKHPSSKRRPPAFKSVELL